MDEEKPIDEGAIKKRPYWENDKLRYLQINNKGGGKEMKFAILKCSGNDGQFIPRMDHIKETLGPYFAERGWQVVDLIAFVEGSATLIGLTGRESANEINSIIPDFYKFIYTNEGKKLAPGSNEYLPIYLGKGIKVIFLGESTEQNGNLFTSFALKLQLETIPKAVYGISESLQRLAKKFEKF